MRDVGDAGRGGRPVFWIMQVLSQGLTWFRLQYGHTAKAPPAASSRVRSSGGLSEPDRASGPGVVSLGAHHQLEIAQEPDERDARVVREAVYAYNRSKAGDQHFEPLTIFLRDGRGRLVGGLIGSTYWKWLTTDFLWVAEELRGRGYGRQLLLAAEQEALRRGCEHAWLDTFSFQAKGFYEKLGYVVFGVLDAFPGQHRRYFLKKKLEA